MTRSRAKDRCRVVMECLSAVLLCLGCAGPAAKTAAPPAARPTQAGDRVTGTFEVVSVHEELLPNGSTHVVFHVRNVKEHRNLEFRASLERVVPETGIVATSVVDEPDYAHHDEELDVEFEVPADARPPGSPALASRLVITIL
ncbi:MAG: hypothetical protein HYR85_07165 [Planctomycetes bacterium]|nr:hypothetical protein [Planctomycetota bacterium]MBI3848536.1 hypothetical protein [Planctomycetota bacterium]